MPKNKKSKVTNGLKKSVHLSKKHEKFKKLKKNSKKFDKCIDI